MPIIIPTHRNTKHSKGFTLAELVIVIILLGILAASILPRFINISDEAELSQAQGVAAALRSGVDMVRVTFVSQGHALRVQNLSGFGDDTVDTNNIGYPIGIDKGNANENIGRGSAGCVGVWQGILSNPPSVAHNNNDQDYRSYRHTANKVCSYVYRAGGDLGDEDTGELVIRYDSRDGSVIVCGTRSDIPGC